MEKFDVSMLPSRPAEALVQQTLQKNGFLKNALVCKNIKVSHPLSGEIMPMVEVKCSNCKEVFYADKVQTGYYGGWMYDGISAKCYDKIPCPCCGEMCEVCYTEQFHDGKREIERQYVVSAEKVGGRFAIVRWKIAVNVNLSAEAELETTIRAAYVVDGNKMLLFENWWRNVTKRANCYDNIGKIDSIYGLNGAFLEGTTVENSKLDVYMQGDGNKYPVSYLRLWLTHKNVENIVMQGGSELLSQLMDVDTKRRNEGRWGGQTYSKSHRPTPKISEIDWKQVKPSKMLGLNKDDYKRCVRDSWGPGFLMIYRQLTDRGIHLSDKEIKQCLRLGTHELQRLIFYGYPVVRTVNYLLNQKRKCQRKNIISADYLNDYLDMAKNAGFDLTVESVRWPADLVKAHDNAQICYKVKKNEAINRKFAQRCKVLKAFTWERDGIVIRPAMSLDELTDEGEKLEHCVARYGESHANGNTAIFFIRRKEKPDKPWYTLELDEERFVVRQNRGKRNCARTEEVQKFEDAWLKHIKTLNIKKKRSKVA